MAESKSMDVAKPGKSAPDSTARPVIVGHKPILKQDPMVNSEEQQDSPDKKTADKPLTPHTEKVIAPPSAEPVKDAASPAAAETPKAETKPEEVTEQKPAETNESEQPVSDDAAVVDALADQAGSGRKKPGELTPEEKKRQEAIDRLIEEKKYFIPIKVAKRKRQARGKLIILSILLLGLGGYLLVDAGVLGANLKVPFNIIPNAADSAAPIQTPTPAPQPNPVPTAASFDEISPVNVQGQSVAIGQLIKYTSGDIGIEFTYPKAWGEVKAQKSIGSDKHAHTGTSVTIEFSANTQPKATLRSRDYKLNGGRGGAYWDAPTQFTYTQSATATSGVQVKNQAWNGEFAEKVLIDEPNLKAHAVCDNFTAAITINAYPYLKANKTFDTGNFYFLIRGANADGSGLDTKGCDNLDSLIKDTEDTFLQFARSIKAI